jgi:hypothetical protein
VCVAVCASSKVRVRVCREKFSIKHTLVHTYIHTHTHTHTHLTHQEFFNLTFAELRESLFVYDTEQRVLWFTEDDTHTSDRKNSIPSPSSSSSSSSCG